MRNRKKTAGAASLKRSPIPGIPGTGGEGMGAQKMPTNADAAIGAFSKKRRGPRLPQAMKRG